MRFNWISFALLGIVSVVSYVFYSAKVPKNISLFEDRKTDFHLSPSIQSIRSIANKSEETSIGTASLANNKSESLNPLGNPFVLENRKKNELINNILNTIRAEKREALSLQIVGSGKWTVFSDLQVSNSAINDSLFNLGPYHISRKKTKSDGSAMSLVYDENQQTLAILTGRLVIKVRDLYDIDPITRDYHLHLDSLSAEIKTAYFNIVNHNLPDTSLMANLNSVLKVDTRIERFYFELVKTDWIKN